MPCLNNLNGMIGGIAADTVRNDNVQQGVVG